MLWVIKLNQAYSSSIDCSFDPICEEEGSILQTGLDLSPPAEDGGTGKPAKHGMWRICHHYKRLLGGMCHHKMVCHNTIQNKILIPSTLVNVCSKNHKLVS